MTRRRPRHPRKRPRHRSRDRPRSKGFSRPGSKQYFEWLGIEKHEKREYFNYISHYVIGAVAIFGAMCGFWCAGWPGAILIAPIAAAAGAWLMVRDRMIR